MEMVVSDGLLQKKALRQTLGRPVMMSISRTIETDRKNYYAGLGKAQRSHEISDWIQYFAEIVLSAPKYMAFTKTSQATATRDLQALVEFGILKRMVVGVCGILTTILFF